MKTETPDERARKMVESLRAQSPTISPWGALELALAGAFTLRDDIDRLREEVAELKEGADVAGLDEGTIAERRAVSIAKARKYTAELAEHYGLSRDEIDRAMPNARSPRPGRERP